MPTLEERISALISQGVSAEEITRAVRKMATQSTKDYFLDVLKSGDPEEYCIQASVSDWACIENFFKAPATDQYHPQRIFRDIRQDIADAIQAQDAQALVLALLLNAKAVQP